METINAKLVFMPKGKKYLIRDEEIKAGDELFLIKKSLLGDIGYRVKVVDTNVSRTNINKSNGEPHYYLCEANYQRDSNYSKVLCSGGWQGQLTICLSLVNTFDQIISESTSPLFDAKRVIDFYKWLRANYGATKPLEEAQIVNKCTAEDVVSKYLSSPLIYNVEVEKEILKKSDGSEINCYKIVKIKDRCD